MQLTWPAFDLRRRIDRALFVGRVIVAAVRITFERRPVASPTPPAPRLVLTPEEREQTCAALARWQAFADWRRSRGDEAGAERLDFGIALRRRLYGCDTPE